MSYKLCWEEVPCDVGEHSRQPPLGHQGDAFSGGEEGAGGESEGDEQA